MQSYKEWCEVMTSEDGEFHKIPHEKKVVMYLNFQSNHTQERNWQEDWDMCEQMNGVEWTTLVDGHAVWKHGGVISTIWEDDYEKALKVTPSVLPYWLQEVKRLREQLAHANVGWQNEKAMRIAAVDRELSKKNRADNLEAMLAASEMLHGLDRQLG